MELKQIVIYNSLSLWAIVYQEVEIIFRSGEFQAFICFQQMSHIRCVCITITLRIGLKSSVYAVFLIVILTRHMSVTKFVGRTQSYMPNTE